MIRRRHIAILARLASLAAFAVALTATPAAAAPSFGVEIQRDSAAFPVVTHSDERVDFSVKVTNAGATTAAAGEKLTCDANAEEWFNDPTFTFEWLSGGTAAAGPVAQPTATTSTYVVQEADEGSALQCLVTATNAGGQAVSITTPIVVAPPPSPPAPTFSGTGRPRPSLSPNNVTDGSERTCIPPTTWAGSPTWTFQWLRDGSPIAGATGEKYLPGPADAFHTIQCEVIGKTGTGSSPAGGTAFAISDSTWTSNPNTTFPSGVPPNIRTDGIPFILSENAASGPVTLELELPGGQGTYAVSAEGSGWTCDRVPATLTAKAKAICTGSGLVLPGKAYPTIAAVTALGADAPDTSVVRAIAFGGGAAEPSSGEYTLELEPAVPFGLSAFESGVFDSEEVFAGGVFDPEGHDYSEAGGHPLLAVGSFALNKKRRLAPSNSLETSKYAPTGHLKDAAFEVPRGFAGNLQAIPQLCPSVEDIFAKTCPGGSMVGVINLVFGDGTGSFGCCKGLRAPIYAMEPEFGTAAQFGFTDQKTLYVITGRVRPGEDGYVLSIESSVAVVDLLEATATLCDFGAKKIGAQFERCWAHDEAGANPKPLFTNPTRCGQPLPVTKGRFTSWEHPGQVVERSFTNAEITDCDEVHFEPEIHFTPTSSWADSPTGMDVELTMPTDGLESPTGIAQANLKRARVMLPMGMSVNGTAGKGLDTCTLAQIGFEKRPSGKIIPNEDPVACPDGSKIGTVEATTPLLDETFKGNVYIARQSDNPFGSLLAVYMVIDSPENGVLVKLAGLVTPNEETGQMEVTFNDNPEVPISSVELHFPQGPRSPLLNPPMCGTQEIVAQLSPWNAQDPENPSPSEIVEQTSTYTIDKGPEGGPCPTNALEAKLSAGTNDPVAGKTSPFVFRLSRDDGTQRFKALSVHTPPGLTAYLKGIPYCPDSVLSSISSAAGTGQAQIDNPACPAASQIGTAVAGAGAGPDPLFVDTGKAYLAGPYKGAPLSIALVAPAVAGPIDLGNVVVRTAVYIDPETAKISAVSDPVPTILHGILLDLRDIRVALNRPDFTLNPTNCEEMSIGVDVKGENGGSASLSNRFQVGGCKNLDFGPKFFLRLFGGTKRGDNPKLRTVLTAGPGESNIGRAAVTIPRSEFLDQSHIRTVCTRVQFAADACPPGSIYGHAVAFTPLLDYPVEGPVYLRSSSHKLPDLVVDLHGPDYQPVEAVVVGRIDSIKGQIRATIEGAPDVPVSKFILTQRGGKRGLLINSREICAHKNRATVKLTGQNGMTHNFRPVVKNGKCNSQRKAKRKHRRQEKRAAAQQRGVR